MSYEKAILDFIKWLDGEGVYLHFYHSDSDGKTDLLPVHYMKDKEKLVKNFLQQYEDKKMICGVVVNDRNEILAYTCAYTRQACEEWCEENLPGWEEMKKLGARVVQAELKICETHNKKGKI